VALPPSQEDIVTKLKLLTTALTFGTLAITTAAQAAPAVEPEVPRPRPTLTLPVTGTLTGGGTFSGTFTLQRFAVRNSRPVAVGILRGSGVAAAGAPLGTVFVAPVEFPVAVSGHAPEPGEPAVQQVCELLNLDLGPINLDVLGLQLTTLPIDIDLIASGEGTDVLGQLICVILETVGNVIGLVNLLNQLLGLLGGLAG
jgi:hypothetical protein